MNQARLSKLLYIGLLGVLVACQALVTPPPSSAVPPAASATTPTVVPATLVPTAEPLEEHVIAEWLVNNPIGPFSGFGSIWIPGHHDLTTTRIDPATNQIIAVIEGTGWRAEQALAVGDLLWVTGQRDDTTAIDPNTNLVATTIPYVKGAHHYIADGFNSLWITTGDNKLDRVDPATGEISASIRYADGYADCQGFVFATKTAVWVDMCDRAELIKVDPATNSVVSKTPYATLIDQAKAQTMVPAGKGTDFIWLSLAENQGNSGIPGGLLRIDPVTGAGVTFLALSPDQLGDNFTTVTDEAVWLGGLGQINRVNVVTNQIDATYTTKQRGNIHLAIGFGSVWLVNYDANLVQRLDVDP
jgi:streptogramin lyase